MLRIVFIQETKCLADFDFACDRKDVFPDRELFIDALHNQITRCDLTLAMSSDRCNLSSINAILDPAIAFGAARRMFR